MKIFIKILQNEIPSPLPLYMIELIKASWENNTLRTLLEGSMATFSAEMGYITSVLANQYKTDEEYNKTEIRNWLSKGGTLTERYALVESYFEEGDFGSAENILNDISTSFNLKDNEEIEYMDYLYYFNFRKNLYAAGKTIAQLEESEVQTLEFMADNHTGRSSTLTQNILCFFYNNCRSIQDVILDENQLRVRVQPSHKEQSSVVVNPNPANVFTSISWSVPRFENCLLKIYDIKGIEVSSKKLDTNEGQWIWDTRKIENGIYIYRLMDNDKQIDSGKIVVNKK